MAEHAAATLTLDIGGVTFGVTLPSPEWRAALADRYAAFLAATEPAWQVAVRWEPGLQPAGDPWVIHEGPVTTFHIGDSAGRIDLEGRCAEARLTSVARAGRGLDRVLAYICMQALPADRAGLLLHVRCGRGGAGLVFTGHSGAGKTTVARLAAGRGEVLVDENVIVRLEDSGAELCSTPFWGGSTPPAMIRRINRRVPLRAICVLEHAHRFEIERLEPAQAALALLTTEKVTAERTAGAAGWLAMVERLLAVTPVYRLGFLPTPALWDFLASALP